MFAAGEQGLWSYIQQLEERMKSLSEEVAAGRRSEAALLERVGNCERREATLTAEVAQLRQQLGVPASDNAPARP
jgi:Mg2+ and Co2+ transporter CorA